MPFHSLGPNLELSDSLLLLFGVHRSCHKLQLCKEKVAIINFELENVSDIKTNFRFE